MEVFMRNIDWNSNRHQVTTELERILHGPNFAHLSEIPINFHVHLHPNKSGMRNHRGIRNHGGTGALTLPSSEVGTHFLELHGSDRPKIPLVIGNKAILFLASKNPNGRSDVVERITLQPYVKPWIQEERERRATRLQAGSIPIKTIQFGWECRDYVFSIECEEHCEDRATLKFDDERREIRIALRHGQEYFIALRYSHIQSMTAHNYLGQEAAIVFSLNTPPTYEIKREASSLRQRLSFLPIPEHESVSPYASLAMRLVCPSPGHLKVFRDLCATAQLHKIDEYEYPIDRRMLFSSVALADIQTHLRRVNWRVAFQIEALVRSMVVDPKEVLELMPRIYDMVHHKGKVFTATMLRKFGARAKRLFWDDEEAGTTVLQCFNDTLEEVSKSTSLDTLKPTEGSLCDTFHVKITPTTMFLDGPFPERSNRVIRAYEPIHQESFLRVSFLDEARLQYRFDRDVDGPLFIRERVGPFLLFGLTIAGRTFEFLAYSQSALKEHAVWFVKPFRDRVHGYVDAKSIIRGLGNFEALDKKLVYCPARYAARLSQAFTATDAVEVEVEEILPIDDIETADGRYQFTDGIGTLSKDLAREIWSELKSTKRRGRIRKLPPSSYQIRFQGSKGMLSVDYKLSGFVMCLRPSMIKFDAPNSTAIEIARAFDRPGAYFLNRPLIMLLEGLGIPYEVFKKYQDDAVFATKNAARSLDQAAGLFESYGLGASYRLSSVMLSLEKLFISSLPDNEFYGKMLVYAIHHVLRDLKNRARIPIPGAWTLVGVADVHRFLKPREIFACIKPVNGKTIYLEGPVLISRSPTIHPGDATIVTAIGRPPPGTPFAFEPLANTVVFSILGDRPIPSCLGGGDLDGDLYNVIPLESLPEFVPEQLHPPAKYDPAPRKFLDRPSTMADVAEFVMEYINSDVVGIIAMNWLLTADSSSQGIFDENCMKLANLHSDAVDYPKSGQPVALDKIPKVNSRLKPDWNAPETVNISSSEKYYPSQRAIGRLFRAIDLPVEQLPPETNSKRWRAKVERTTDFALDDVVDSFSSFSFTQARDSPLFAAIEDRVNEFIDTDIKDAQDDTEFISELFNRYTSELRGICASNTLSHARNAQLSEEEAIIGTIVQKSSQPRHRTDTMAKLREGTDILVRAIREELVGDDSIGIFEHLYRAWLAWKGSVSQGKAFGAQSFGWVALGAIFEAIREIEESQKERGSIRSF